MYTHETMSRCFGQDQINWLTNLGQMLAKSLTWIDSEASWSFIESGKCNYRALECQNAL